MTQQGQYVSMFLETPVSWRDKVEKGSWTSFQLLSPSLGLSISNKP